MFFICDTTVQLLEGNFEVHMSAEQVLLDGHRKWEYVGLPQRILNSWLRLRKKSSIFYSSLSFLVLNHFLQRQMWPVLSCFIYSRGTPQGPLLSVNPDGLKKTGPPLKQPGGGDRTSSKDQCEWYGVIQSYQVVTKPSLIPSWRVAALHSSFEVIQLQSRPCDTIL